MTFNKRVNKRDVVFTIIAIAVVGALHLLFTMPQKQQKSAYVVHLETMLASCESSPEAKCEPIRNVLNKANNMKTNF